MKVINIDFDRYQFPEGCTNLHDFVKMVNLSDEKFILMKQYSNENCVFPYLISDEMKDVYINFSAIMQIFTEEATILSKKEYDEQLAAAVTKKCLDCVNYEEDMKGDNLKGHRDTLSLDGECYLYEKKDED